MSTFETLYAYPTGRTSRADFLRGLLPLLAAAAFYALLVKVGRNGEWVMVMFLFPGSVLLARRLHDLGQTAWLLLAPGALAVAAIWMHMANKTNPPLEPAVALAAAIVIAGFFVWGLAANGQADANRYGPPPPA